ncbi:hypothetical protein C8R44DRAFT_746419 [Mycena epipterygia]|nr:hypothetical protein C8R44DRAFT_746419 [Mycena epipterygia]
MRKDTCKIARRNRRFWVNSVCVPPPEEEQRFYFDSGDVDSRPILVSESAQNRSPNRARIDVESSTLTSPNSVTILFLRLPALRNASLGPECCKEPAEWTTNPEDLTHLLEILRDKKGRIGDGENFDKTVMNETAVEMATKWPPKKDVPKTAKACTKKWKATCKLCEYILQAKQKAYPGVSVLGMNIEPRTKHNILKEGHDKQYEPSGSLLGAEIRWRHAER